MLIYCFKFIQWQNELAKELQILANKARVMCSLIGCVLVQTSYGIALAFTSWCSDYFQSPSPSWARSTYCRCLLGNQSFQSGCCFPGRGCWKDLGTCAIVFHLFSGLMKMLAQSGSINCFQHSSNKLFVQPFFVNFHLWQQLSMNNGVKLSAFEKNYSSVWCHAYICFHLIK